MLGWPFIGHSRRVPFNVLPGLSNELPRRLCLLPRPDLSTPGQRLPPTAPDSYSEARHPHPWRRARFWFASLVLSLTSAVFATLAHEWVRRYMLLTQTRFSPHRRVPIRAYLAQEKSLGRLQHMIESLSTSLHLSIFMFLLGHITPNSGGDSAVIVRVCLYIAIPPVLYL